MDWAALVERYRLADRVTGVVHCGAHLAEEAPDYDRALGPTVPVWWIEANPGVYAQIEEALSPYPRQRLVRALLAEVDGDNRQFHVTNYDGMSSSLLDFGTHPEFSPDTVFVKHLTLPTRCLDSLAAEYAMGSNMLVMDLQGAEGMCLAGASGVLDHTDFVMSEVNKAEVYKGCAKVNELDDTLGFYGLERVETLWVANYGWGDALWVRR